MLLGLFQKQSQEIQLYIILKSSNYQNLSEKQLKDIVIRKSYIASIRFILLIAPILEKKPRDVEVEIEFKKSKDQKQSKIRFGVQIKSSKSQN